MYIPDQFNDSTIEEAAAFIKENSFGILINTTGGKLWATHIPMELYKNDEGKDVLMGHIARANNQWKGFNENDEVLAVFRGPHAYISPSWYTKKNVPTWNYVAVHVYGRIKIIEGTELYQALKRLIDTYETITKTHLTIEDIPEKIVKKDLRGIIGFEITIEEVKAAFKLSQNKDDESYKNIIDNLEASDDQEIKKVADYMKNRRKDNF